MNIVVNEQTSKIIVVNQGLKGEPGPGLKDGGTTGQVLAKASNANQDTEWIDPAQGDLIASNNLSDVDNKDVARNNLGAVSVSESVVNALIFG